MGSMIQELLISCASLSTGLVAGGTLHCSAHSDFYASPCLVKGNSYVKLYKCVSKHKQNYSTGIGYKQFHYVKKKNANKYGKKFFEEKLWN